MAEKALEAMALEPRRGPNWSISTTPARTAHGDQEEETGSADADPAHQLKEKKAALPFFLDFAQKMFQPLLLFFYLGFLIPLLKVPYEFPKQIYQGITLYLLVAIGWHGGKSWRA